MQSVKPEHARRGLAASTFFSMGFRPFFFSAALLAVLAIAVWVLSLHGVLIVDPEMGMRQWHLHEMVFGYGAAVLTGFLLTAVPNWTGRSPLSGMILIGLFSIWVLGRIALMLPLDGRIAGTVDSLFLPIVGMLVAREIVAARNWRNLMVLGPILVFALANILFLVGTYRNGSADVATRLGLGALTLLVMLIGGRIVPAFTRNWLVQQRAKRLPQQFNRFDGLCMILGAVALLVWMVLPYGAITGALLIAAAALHAARLSRWAGWATRSNALLFVLHVAYAMIPASLLLLGLAALMGTPGLETAGLHLLGIGVVGGMTLSVMMRASLGHTGQPLRADSWLGAALALLFAAALARVMAQATPFYSPLVDLAGLLWILAFGLFLLRIGPLLLKPQPGGAPH